MNSNALANAVIRQEIEALQNTIKTLRYFLIHFFLDDSTTDTSPSVELTQRSAPTFLGVFDIDGKENHTGDTVGFLSKGHFKSKQGTVYKVSKKRRRITSMDNEGRNISRAPENIRITGQSGARVD